MADLAVEQEGDDAVLTFSFPDRLLTGGPLTDLESIEVYRVVKPSPALTAPRPPGRAAASAPGGTTGELRGLGASARREATNVRLAEEAFYRDSQRVAALSLPAIAESTRGATIVYRDPLAPLLTAGEAGRAAGLRRRLREAQRRAQPALQHRGLHARRRARRARASAPDPRGGARLPRVAAAGERRPRPAGRRSAGYQRLPPAPAAGGVRRSADEPTRRRNGLRGRGRALRRAARRTRSAPRSRRTRRSRVSRPKSCRFSCATSSRRRPRLASTPCPRPASSGSSGIRWTRRTSRGTSSTGRRAAAAPARLTKEPLTEPFFTDQTVLAGPALPLHRALRRPGRERKPAVARGRRRSLLTE